MMRIARNFKRWRERKAHASAHPSGDRAGLADLRAAYRLILGREPDAAGFDQYAEKIARAALSTGELFGSFIGSDEFRNRRAPVGVDRAAAPGGTLAEDAARIEQQLRAGSACADRAFYVDYSGQRIHPAHHPAIADRLGQVGREVPLPDDGHLSDGIEYAAAALAVENARGRDAFVAVECGAGWGPWTTLFGLTARRHGFERIHLVAFEADAARFGQLREHLAQNALVAADRSDSGESGGLRWQLFNAAVSWRDETLLWPQTGNVFDAGMRAEPVGALAGSADYRGFAVGHREIPALGLAGVFADGTVIDIIHMDIQGSEAAVIPALVEFLERQVRSIFIGTHSRKIEGDLFELFYGRGWVLEREQPCRFDPGSQAPTLDGKTTHDGAQYWRNPRMV